MERIFLVFCLLFCGSKGQIVDTIHGKVEGHLVTLDDGTRINSFYGIPFAKQPVGDLRFKNPEEPDPWDDVFVADELPPICPQDPGIIYITHPLWDYIEEGCLNLNIFAPNDTSGGPYPVMVWFHGGAYLSSGNIQYPGHFLARRGVIVVVPNYRLGALGFLSTEDEASPGNYGMYDQIRALEFVRDNIAAFGGDPNKVTIFGQSAGGSSSGLHMVSPKSDGLFHQAILESGTELALWAVLHPDQEPVEYTRHVAAKFNCSSDDTQEMVDCMRNVDATALHQNQGFPCKPGWFCQGFAPVVDGADGFLPDEPLTLRQQGKYKEMPMMAGQCENDGSFYTLGMIPESIDGGFNRSDFEDILRNRLVSIFSPLFPEREEDVFETLKYYYTYWPYTEDVDLNRESFNEMITDVGFGYTGDKQIKFHANNSDAWYYILGIRSSNASAIFPEWMGVPHNGELPYVWGWALLQNNFDVRVDSGILIDLIEWNQQDAEWAEYIITLWTNFAKFGDPTPEPVTPPEGNDPTTWKKFSNSEMNYLYINYETSDEINYMQKNHALWQSYLRYLTGIEFKGNTRGQAKSQLNSNQVWDNISNFYKSQVNKVLKQRQGSKI